MPATTKVATLQLTVILYPAFVSAAQISEFSNMVHSTRAQSANLESSSENESEADVVRDSDVLSVKE